MTITRIDNPKITGSESLPANTSDFELKKAETASELSMCLKIRKTVFIIGQNVPEELEVDELDKAGSHADHFLMLKNGSCVGTFRTVRVLPDVIKLQRFCVLEKFRNQSIGSMALEELEKYYKDSEISTVILDAQLPAIRFYERAGYKVVSEEFEEAGIMHKKMSKTIGS